MGTARSWVSIAAGCVMSLYAGPQGAEPAFDVASIKRDVSGEARMFFRIIPTFHLEGVTLRRLVMMAYRVQDFQVTGGPDWIDSGRYDIDAKGEAPTVVDMAYRDLQYRRLQTLLRDRFHLAVHRETKELPIYELTVAKGGPKLQRPECIVRPPGDTTVAPGKTPGDYCGLIGGGRNGIDSNSTTMANFADFLSSAIGRQVVDKTGIEGEYQIHLTYSLELSPDGAAGDLRPDIFTAMQGQLGLKLESAKGPVQVLVIERVEKASEN